MQPNLEKYRLMKKYILCLAAALVSSISAWAVMASPEPFEYTRPDGTTVMARVYGDEFHSYIESLDGELLYGSRDVEVMEQAAERRRARRIQQAAGNSAFPVFGSPRSLVLLVSFADLDMGESLQDFRDLLNKSGYDYNGATGSCRDYYIASSDSLFTPQFDCFGPYKLSRNMEYYGADQGEDHNVHAAEMVAEVCQLAHEAGVNFKDYDTNGDGQLDNVFIFYAGNNQAEGADANTIWPHQGNISYKNIRLDGVLVASYACTSEYKGRNSTTRCGVGTFCHEFGHVIGQPDFYDTDYNYYSVADWDIMCSGSYNNDGRTPPTFSAFERMYEGWLTPKQLELPGTYTLSVEPGKAEAYLIAADAHNLSGKNPSPTEFFLLENRNSNNIWDSYLPGHGMLVWHVDYSASAWTSNTPNNGPTIMRMHLEEANGIGWKKRSQGEGGRSSDPYPGTNNVQTFNPTLHNGTQLAQPLFNIEENGGVVRFTYISEGGSSLRANKQDLTLTTTLSDKNAVESWEPQVFELLGTGLDPNQDITVRVNAANFSLFAGESAPALNSSNWKTILTLRAEADSSLQQPIWVKFHPKKQDCTAAKSTISISASTASTAISVVGYAPRHTYVVTPTVEAPYDVTPYSFTTKWYNQEDAEHYYLTLYQVSEGETKFVQGFEDFDDYAKIREQGWESNTNLTTNSAKADGVKSLYIKNHGDQITSETYPAAITSISFWYNAFSSTKDTIGVLVVETYYNDEWWLVDNLVVKNTAKRETAQYDFDEAYDLRTFRLTWLDNGGSGIAFDAFTAIIPRQIDYIYKGRTKALDALIYGDSIHYTFTGLEPDETYYYQVQTTDLDKGCEEHLTALSEPIEVHTIAGQPLDGKQLTLAVDSINYNPAQHAIYLIEPKAGDYLFFYNAAGRLVYRVAVKENVCIYALDLNKFRTGEVYLVQHATNGALGRKNKWLKFIY